MARTSRKLRAKTRRFEKDADKRRNQSAQKKSIFEKIGIKPTTLLIFIGILIVLGASSLFGMLNSARNTGSKITPEMREFYERYRKLQSEGMSHTDIIVKMYEDNELPPHIRDEVEEQFTRMQQEQGAPEEEFMQNQTPREILMAAFGDDSESGEMFDEMRERLSQLIFELSMKGASAIDIARNFAPDGELDGDVLRIIQSILDGSAAEASEPLGAEDEPEVVWVD